jgi:hypothetical protein
MNLANVNNVLPVVNIAMIIPLVKYAMKNYSSNTIILNAWKNLVTYTVVITAHHHMNVRFVKKVTSLRMPNVSSV